MDFELNNLYESFMHKIDKVKSEKEHNPLGKMRQEIDDEFSAPVKFACPQLGKYIQDKFNQGRTFSVSSIARCPLPVDNKFFYTFEQSELGRNLVSYTFNEFRFFKNAVFSIDVDIDEAPKVTELSLPDNWDGIPRAAFNSFVNLVRINYSDNVMEFGNGCFSNDSKLESVKIPFGTKRIGQAAFNNCESLTEVDLPITLKHLEASTFSGCKGLKKVTVPSEVVDTYCFTSCSSLKSVEFLPMVKKVSQGAFSDCTSLKKVTVHSKVNFDPLTFFNFSVGKPKVTKFNLYAPKSLEDFYSDPNLSIHENIRHLICR